VRQQRRWLRIFQAGPERPVSCRPRERKPPPCGYAHKEPMDLVDASLWHGHWQYPLAPIPLPAALIPVNPARPTCFFREGA
jgi:hypothetical protein